jgi:hypothetical protein
MLNRMKGEARFEHDGKAFDLVFDAEAFLRVEDLTGVGLFEMDGAMAKLGFVAALLVAGLARGGVELDRVAAAEMLMVNPAVRVAVGEALDRALPKEREDEAAVDPPKAARKAGTGTKS